MEDIIISLKDNKHFGKQISERLKPLYDWDRALINALEKITNCILNALEDGKSISILNNKSFEYATLGDVSLLEGLIRDLAKEGYSKHAGKLFEARTPLEKEKLSTLNKKLNDLSYVLKRIVNDVAKKVLDREMDRVKDAIENLFVFHLESLQKSATDTAPDLAINFPQTVLTKVSCTVNPNFSFEGGFPVLQESYTEEVTKKTGTKRVWFFFNKDIYVTKVEKRSSDNAHIPSFEELDRGWKLQKERGEIEAYNVILAWWKEQFNQFDRGVGKFQADVIDEYQIRLDRAYRDNRIDHDSKMEAWKPLKGEAELVSSRINQLGAEWKSR
ncbi:MAG: hypothetical protein DCF15_18840 [Phormidesmis priestleyi]|uniref:Uncharacterized protein n=1 Tax=Phormidesmis priestleyi TaxID=268141 RepID=A0A2W4WX47_9CYAN|nr:MAG: hypothetical protein DCF15_18840 [Phormidesmis priestleyi]